MQDDVGQDRKKTNVLTDLIKLYNHMPTLLKQPAKNTLTRKIKQKINHFFKP